MDIEKFYEFAMEFLVQYGLQILGGVIILLVGLRLAAIVGKKTVVLAERKGIDTTFARFAGNAVKLALVALVIVITLASFGVTIAPLVAIVGAGTFGIALAVQGPLSNYGAGLVIILTRPYVVGNTIRVLGWHGVVEEITLAATTLRGEDRELISIPNKRVLGEVLVNSDEVRMAEARLYVRQDQDFARAVEAVRLAVVPLSARDAEAVDVGITGFFYGGAMIGIRAPVESLRFYETAYAINAAAFEALREAGIELAAPPAAALVSAALGEPPLSGPEPPSPADPILPR